VIGLALAERSTETSARRRKGGAVRTQEEARSRVVDGEVQRSPGVDEAREEKVPSRRVEAKL
jgi:hypothetical protein